MYASEKDYWKKKYPWQYPSGDLHPDQRQAYLDSYHNASTRAALLPQDGYLSGGQFAEEAKLDGRKLSKGETMDRINPFTGHYNQQEYRDKYNPDGSLRNAPFSMMDYLNPAQASLPQEPQTTPALDTLPVENLDEMGQGTFPRGMLGLEDAPQGDESFIPPVEERPFNENGVLNGIIESVGSDGTAGTGTNNKRQNTATAEDIERKKQDKEERQKKMMAFAEMMGRYGGNIMNAGSRGGMAQVGAMGTTTAQIADLEREIAQQEIDNEIARGRAVPRPDRAQAKAQEDLNSQIQSNTQKANHFDYLIDRIKQEGDNLTGLYDGTVQAGLDSLQGNPRAALRLEMSQARVDAALKNVAETKGAISNKEMTLFLSPMPKLGVDQESVWIAWLEMQSGLTKVLNTRLKGEQLSDGTLASKMDLNAKLDSDLQALYQNYLNAQSSQSKVSDDNDELFNF